MNKNILKSTFIIHHFLRKTDGVFHFLMTKHHYFGKVSRSFHFIKTQQGRIQMPYDANEQNDVEQDKRETNN